MNYEVVRAYCGWPSKVALKDGVPALDVFPCGWRTLVLQRGYKWTTILDPLTLQKEKVRTSKLEGINFAPSTYDFVRLADAVSSKLSALGQKEDQFLAKLLLYLRGANDQKRSGRACLPESPCQTDYSGSSL